MLKEIETHREQIADLCRRYGVKRLELFGSAARGTDIEPGRSDVDFLIEFNEGQQPLFDEYFELQDELKSLLGHEVDLVAPSILRNPYIRAQVEKSRELLYAT